MLSDFGKNDILKVAFFGVSVFPFLVSLSYLIRKCGPGSRPVHTGALAVVKRQFSGPSYGLLCVYGPKSNFCIFWGMDQSGPSSGGVHSAPGGLAGGVSQAVCVRGVRDVVGW